jgi:uncharacterized protein (TIGR01619 family)
MDGNWEFYPVKVEGQAASIFLDLALAGDAPLADFPTVAFVRLFMRAPRPDGMASQEEFETLVAIEDALIPRVIGEGQAIFAGRNTGSGKRDFFFYLNDSARFEREVISAMVPFEAYRFEMGHRDDPQWGVYFDFLFPMPVDMQRILNRQVCDRLREHGDDLAKPRAVDHAAIFTDGIAAASFVEQAKGEGFTVTQNGEEPDEHERHVVLFVRDDAPVEIDRIVLPLFEQVTALGGVYDGWGCAVAA